MAYLRRNQRILIRHRHDLVGDRLSADDCWSGDEQLTHRPLAVVLQIFRVFEFELHTT